MNTTNNPIPAVSSTPKRIILASAYRHERRSASRQERACKALHKMGHFDDNDGHDSRRVHLIPSADETMDD